MEATDTAPPPVAALFEVVFDQKVGYTISWKRNLSGLDLDGVEFKCLPSGLHSVKEDLVYFVHGGYAGVSAFVQGEADEQHRNANFVAIGALVPLTYGRLGKSWKHAAELRTLAKERVANGPDARRDLELFWKIHAQDEATARDDNTSPSRVRSMPFSAAHSDSSRKRKRARSDASANYSAADAFSTDHPALFMTDLVDAFGPLIFPLYRVSLLRKRVLFIGSPPVQRSCNFVYLLSILSGIPQSLAGSLQPHSDAPLRIQTLFSVGVHDMPFLADEKRAKRWLACTTDDILEEKKELYDIVVKLPPPKNPGSTKEWPRMRTADGVQIRATQRDLRRYRLLRAELDRTATLESAYRDDPDASGDDAGPTLPSIVRAPTAVLLNEVKRADPGETDVCEPVTWSAMAYNGFMWWASAGEMEAWENEETRADRQLLEAIPEAEDLLRHIADPSNDETEEEQRRAQLRLAEATVLTAYFHRLTAEILEPLADLVESADDDTEEGIADAAIEVSTEDIRIMGLDPWSTADKQFVVNALELYFGRDARIEEGGTRVCGVRIC